MVYFVTLLAVGFFINVIEEILILHILRMLILPLGENVVPTAFVADLAYARNLCIVCARSKIYHNSAVFKFVQLGFFPITISSLHLGTAPDFPSRAIFGTRRGIGQAMSRAELRRSLGPYGPNNVNKVAWAGQN